jgi:hypothetical protein
MGGRFYVGLFRVRGVYRVGFTVLVIEGGDDDDDGGYTFLNYRR